VQVSGTLPEQGISLPYGLVIVTAAFTWASFRALHPSFVTFRHRARRPVTLYVGLTGFRRALFFNKQSPPAVLPSPLLRTDRPSFSSNFTEYFCRLVPSHSFSQAPFGILYRIHLCRLGLQRRWRSCISRKPSSSPFNPSKENYLRGFRSLPIWPREMINLVPIDLARLPVRGSGFTLLD